MGGFDLHDGAPGLEEQFKRIFGRSLDEPAEQQVLNEGDSGCLHHRVLYIDNAFDGQAWWCDVSGCGRHERMDYSPGFKMKFPRDALIRTPNPEYGGENTYVFRANSEGLAKLLPRTEWTRRK
ncbi:MAG TPA: hypothetical protein VJ142_03070 [Candidatus Nanoarchaeia archaeon]|nr:hypothetical protein [Candidatus Nanoarchaeia archaeon]